ncbi:NADH dehydrogenase [Vallitalea longa]|uniref:NADH dehydrogenase n=1 Tax=Vallitalea longa TaxID=2936439 RepID=A0A9W6DFU2_9FIRM|nr:NAD(P)H-dependent oxidoreductase subunit E [Vallitalea longa]GKX31606.1 NADH dehydrogenase [Vallitalea longa]
MNNSSSIVLSENQWYEIDKIIKDTGNDQHRLIPMLEKIQNYLGYIPVCVQEKISKKTGIPEAEIYGVVSFYSYFTMEPRARHRVQVCLGTACYVKGGKEIADRIKTLYNVEAGQSTTDGRFTYEEARCFGTCGLAPVIVVDGEVYGKVKVEDIEQILGQYK